METTPHNCDCQLGRRRGLWHLIHLKMLKYECESVSQYGLIGSTEWGEDFASWIDEHVVAYFNLDSSTSGSRFGASASPSLAHFVRATAEQIPHPDDPHRTLWDATKDNGILFGKNIVEDEVRAMFEEEINAADSIGVSVLGSGSDYTVFLQRNGASPCAHLCQFD